MLDSNTFPSHFNFDLNEEDSMNNEPIRDINHVVMNAGSNIHERSS